MHDGQRPRDHDCARRWQAGKVGELGEAILAGAEQKCMAGKGGIKAVSLARVGANRLHADPDDRCFRGQPTGALDGDARSVRPGVVGVQKPLLIARSSVPSRAVQEPTARWQRAMFALPGLDVRDLEQVVRIVRTLAALVDDCRRGDQLPRRNLGDVDPLPSGNPVDRSIEVGTHVLAGGDVVPVPGRSS